MCLEDCSHYALPSSSCRPLRVRMRLPNRSVQDRRPNIRVAYGWAARCSQFFPRLSFSLALCDGFQHSTRGFAHFTTLLEHCFGAFHLSDELNYFFPVCRFIASSAICRFMFASTNFRFLQYSQFGSAQYIEPSANMCPCKGAGLFFTWLLCRTIPTQSVAQETDA